jgi:2-C-methyl-D-erythritol 4-phosphate cytidylyltransferase
VTADPASPPTSPPEPLATVVVVPGDPLAFKITRAEDLAYAEWLLAGRQ